VLVVPILLGSLLASAAPAQVAGPMPVLSRVEPAADGYVLVGRDFGTKRDQVQVFEDGRSLPAASVISVANDRIVVRSEPTGKVQHRVVAGGRASAPVSFTHSVAARGLQPKQGTAGTPAVIGQRFQPKTVTAQELTMIGQRFQPKAVTPPELSMIGQRFQPKTVTTQELTMIGQR
jgi:hypothetical protein